MHGALIMERPALTFSLRGFSERETLLFRSFVNIVSHRSSYRWIWQEDSAAHGSDLLVLHADAPPLPEKAPAARQILPAQTGAARPGCLPLPLRAQDILQHLERIGQLLAPLEMPGPQAALHSAPLRLLRWPPQQLLQGTAHTRMATLLGVAPLTLEALCRHSGVAPATAAAFVEKLHAHGLLQWAAQTPPTPSPAHSPAVRGGLLGSIRRRLGI